MHYTVIQVIYYYFCHTCPTAGQRPLYPHSTRLILKLSIANPFDRHRVQVIYKKCIMLKVSMCIVIKNKSVNQKAD